MSTSAVSEDRFEKECMEKGRQLELLYEKDPNAANKLVKGNISSLYEGLRGLVNEMSELVTMKAEIEGAGALKKIKVAKNMEKRMNEIMERYKPFLDTMKVKKSTMVASIMFTVKPEFVNEMAMVTAVLLRSVGQMGGQSETEGGE